jgi:hypothetical protein
VIYVGLDDTDTEGTPGTNQLARRIASALPPGFRLRMVLRHQLLTDPRVPCTTRNGSASLVIRRDEGGSVADLLLMLRQQLNGWYVPGSDPGLCLATDGVPAPILAFGRRCQRELVSQDEARALASSHGLHLEAFGGTGDGVIGALAAVGLAAGGNDGRVVHLPGWSWPDPFHGPHDPPALHERGVQEIRLLETGAPVSTGRVDVGKHLRPACRDHLVVLFVRPAPDAPGRSPRDASDWQAVKLN